MTSRAIERAISLGTLAGLVTWGYNQAAKSGKLGESTPYIDNPALAGGTVAVTTVVARILSKNPFVALEIGSLTFATLCIKGKYNDLIREITWDAYYLGQKVPCKEMLILEMKKSDERAIIRRETAERLLKEHYS